MLNTPAACSCACRVSVRPSTPASIDPLFPIVLAFSSNAPLKKKKGKKKHAPLNSSFLSYPNRPFTNSKTLTFKASLDAKPLIRKFFSLFLYKLIFTRKVSHLASFWKGEFWNLLMVHWRSEWTDCYTDQEFQEQVQRWLGLSTLTVTRRAWSNFFKVILELTAPLIDILKVKKANFVAHREADFFGMNKWEQECVWCRQYVKNEVFQTPSKTDERARP